MGINPCAALPGRQSGIVTATLLRMNEKALRSAAGTENEQVSERHRHCLTTIPNDRSDRVATALNLRRGIPGTPAATERRAFASSCSLLTLQPRAARRSACQTSPVAEASTSERPVARKPSTSAHAARDGDNPRRR